MGSHHIPKRLRANTQPQWRKLVSCNMYFKCPFTYERGKLMIIIFPPSEWISLPQLLLIFAAILQTLDSCKFFHHLKWFLDLHGAKRHLPTPELLPAILYVIFYPSIFFVTLIMVVCTGICIEMGFVISNLNVNIVLSWIDWDLKGILERSFVSWLEWSCFYYRFWWRCKQVESRCLWPSKLQCWPLTNHY